MPLNRSIVHIDMDAFFASVEQRDNSALKGCPVIIGADPKIGRGVVAAASYEARRYGVKSAMPILKAHKLCPHGIFLGVDIEKYKKVSYEIEDILKSYTPLVEKASLDEAFLDLSDVSNKLKVKDLAKSLQNRIKQELDLSCSVGLSYNKFLAKLASDWKKPGGFMVVTEDDIKDFLWPLSVEKIWGVGPKTKQQLYSYGIKTIGSLASYPVNLLKKKFGVYGEELWLLAWGKDNRPVKPYQFPKSLAKETTFDYDTKNKELLLSSLMSLAENICYRLREKKILCKTITLKLRYEDFSTITRSQTFSYFTNDDRQIYLASKNLLEKSWNGEAVRLIGAAASNLLQEKHQQLSIFDTAGKDKKLLEAVDDIRAKHGFESISRARVLSREFPRGRRR